MNNALTFILELLWGTWWGKCLVILIVGGSFFYVIFGKTPEKRQAQLRQQLPEGLEYLAMYWSFFSRRAITWKARAFCEAYCAGWNRQNLAETLAPHVTPELLTELEGQLARQVAMGSYEVIDLTKSLPTELYQVLTPTEERPPTVYMLTGFRDENHLSKGHGADRQIRLRLIFTDEGEWRVGTARFGKFALADAPESDYDTTWLEQNTWPELAPEKQRPEPPKERLEDAVVTEGKVRHPVTSGCLVVVFSILLLGALAWPVYLVLQAMDGRELRKSGAQTQAEVIKERPAKRMSYVTYQFQVDGFDEIYERQVSLPIKVADEIRDEGQLIVVYHHEDPSRNRSLAKEWTNWGDTIVGLMVIIGVPAFLLNVSIQAIRDEKATNRRHFWEDWEEDETQAERMEDQLREDFEADDQKS